MPRTARLDIPGLLQHVIVRGVERCVIFRDDDDRRRFIQKLSTLLVQTNTECLAWALLDNHCHLLLRPRGMCLAPFMRRLLTGYAIYFNLRHKRAGHLFQNRYKSIVCEEDAYLLELVRYIHLNPLRAGIVGDLVALDGYPWSGHVIIMGKTALDGQATAEILAIFAKGRRAATKKYRLFVADGIALGKREELGGGRRLSKSAAEELGEESFDARILGSEEFIEVLRLRRELETGFSQRMPLSTIVEKVCRHFAMEPGNVRLCSRAAGIADVRSVICYLAVRHVGHSGVEVGKYVNLRRSGVCVAADRGEKMVQSHPMLMALIDQ